MFVMLDWPGEALVCKVDERTHHRYFAVSRDTWQRLRDRFTLDTGRLIENMVTLRFERGEYIEISLPQGLADAVSCGGMTVAAAHAEPYRTILLERP